VRELPFGGASLERYGTPLTKETLDACRSTPAILLGAVGDPRWDDFPKDRRPEAGLLRLRKELDLYANLRPIKVYPALIGASSLKSEVIREVDILIVRELTGGIYFGQPRFTTTTDTGEYAVDTMEYHTAEILRIAEKALEMAGQRRGNLCSVDKANVLDTSRLWRNTVSECARQWGNVHLRHMLVDNCAMQLIRQPGQFDVIVTSNMFGDILSDEASMITGSIGMLPSASLGETTALFEPVHGSAPDIAGQDQANPIAAIASVAMLCRYALDLEDAACEIEEAIDATLADGFRTADIYTRSPKEYLVNTSEMGSAILKHLNPNLQPGTFL
jgi:3-isopropylmalate dehydrogenase